MSIKPKKKMILGVTLPKQKVELFQAQFASTPSLNIQVKLPSGVKVFSVSEWIKKPEIRIP